MLKNTKTCYPNHFAKRNKPPNSRLQFAIKKQRFLKGIGTLIHFNHRHSVKKLKQLFPALLGTSIDGYFCLQPPRAAGLILRFATNHATHTKMWRCQTPKLTMPGV
jgi:hypothetical protein